MDRGSIDLDRYQRIVFLTGAGISVASGLRPYRGPGGLWESADSGGAGLASLSDVEALASMPEEVWRMFGDLRALASTAEPNAAHRAIAELEARADLSGARKQITIITQNVDGLHQRAGSKNVVELHGSIFRTRCHVEACKLEPFDDRDPRRGPLPRCPRCSGLLRPDVVLFGEYIPVDAEHRSKRAVDDCDLFVAVGTSGTVAPASSFVRRAKWAGAHTVLVNLETIPGSGSSFDQQILGRAEQILPRLLASR